MSERWPPMLGVVGFDGGYRSAVALAIPPDELQGGEGEFAGGGGPVEGIGACCYDDGTCDDISEFDCTSAGGTYQGDGTDCASVSCTGVCCEPGCVDDTTPDGCALDGGTFQGFGTTCADDPPPCPPTGACCVDTDCSITTEEGCTGTYQGDDTTCDPNPCSGIPSSCCDGAFQSFDGSCRFFLTKTTVLTTHEDETFTFVHCTGGGSFTTTETIDPDTCESSCVRTGGDTRTCTDSRNGCVTDQCDTPSGTLICGQTTSHRTTQDSDGVHCTSPSSSDITDFDFDGLPNTACISLPGIGGAITVDTATTRTITGTAGLSGFVAVITLSDEVSITGACCDFDALTCSITTSCDCICDACSWFGACSICDDCGFSPFANPFFRNN